MRRYRDDNVWNRDGSDWYNLSRQDERLRGNQPGDYRYRNQGGTTSAEQLRGGNWRYTNTQTNRRGQFRPQNFQSHMAQQNVGFRPVYQNSQNPSKWAGILPTPGTIRNLMSIPTVQTQLRNQHQNNRYDSMGNSSNNYGQTAKMNRNSPTWFENRGNVSNLRNVGNVGNVSNPRSSSKFSSFGKNSESSHLVSSQKSNFNTEMKQKNINEVNNRKATLSRCPDSETQRILNFHSAAQTDKINQSDSVMCTSSARFDVKTSDMSDKISSLHIDQKGKSHEHSLTLSGDKCQGHSLTLSENNDQDRMTDFVGKRKIGNLKSIIKSEETGNDNNEEQTDSFAENQQKSPEVDIDSKATALNTCLGKNLNRDGNGNSRKNEIVSGSDLPQEAKKSGVSEQQKQTRLSFTGGGDKNEFCDDNREGQKTEEEKKDCDKTPGPILVKPISQSSKTPISINKINQSKVSKQSSSKTPIDKNNQLDNWKQTSSKKSDSVMNKSEQEKFENYDQVRRRILGSEFTISDEVSFKPIKHIGNGDEEANDRSDDDIIFSDSSDEELEQPSFLASLEEACNRPIPGTPTKFSKLENLSQSSNPGSPLLVVDNRSDITEKTALSVGFTLDSLLAEKTEKFEEQKEYGQLKSKLKAEIKKGGFVVDTLEETEDTSDDGLLPEHEIKLQRFQVSESSIKDVHPGEEIFTTQRYKQMFTETLRPQDCGFVPGSTYIDNYIATVLPGDYLSFLSSDLFGMCFGNISCPDAVCRWIYYIMSIHSSHLVMNGCCNILEEHINTQKHYTSGPTWSPSAKDLLIVLLNCGATVELLLPDQLNIPGKEELKDSIQVLNNDNQDGHHDNNARYNRENLRLAIRVLALCLQGRPKHTAKQLTCMLIMLCKAASDQSLNNFMLTYEVQVCLSYLLLGYSTEEWQSQAPYLCQLLSGLTNHHHNMVYLVQLFKHGKRTEYIQRRISYMSLKRLFNVAPPDLNDIDNFQLADLKHLVPRIRELAGLHRNRHDATSQNVADLYKLVSSISLLDMSVGNGLIKSSEKSDLQFLTDQLMKLTGDVRDNVASLDATRVKDKMVCVTSKWTLYLSSIGSKQRTIFAYCPNKQQEVHIETVQSTQSDHDSDQSSDEESQGNQEDSGHTEDAKAGPSKQTNPKDTGASVSGGDVKETNNKINETEIGKEKSENIMDVSVANIDSIDNNMDDSEMVENSELADSVEDSEMQDELPDLVG